MTTFPQVAVVAGVKFCVLSRSSGWAGRRHARMQFARRLRVFATRRRGTVARTNLRLAAGVGVVAAFFSVGGPSAAVAIADPGGGSHSGRVDSGRGSGNGRGGSRGGSDWNDERQQRQPRRQRVPAARAVRATRVGSGRDSGTSDQRPSSDFSPDRPGQFKAPKVTFGDGRSPGVQAPDTEPRWRGGRSGTGPTAATAAEVITVPLNPPTVSARP